MLVVAGAVALAAPALLHVYDRSGGGAVSIGDARNAGTAALIAAVCAGVAWALLSAASGAIAAGPSGARARALASWLLAGTVAIAIILVGATQPLAHDVRRQWHTFTHLAEPGEGRTPGSAVNTRLLTGAGNRYDYWRIAWAVWREQPILGVGAGNYARPYYERRATSEAVDQPHSLELQVLSELGIIGALLLACSVAGVFWGAVRMRRSVAASPLRLALLTSGLGIFTTWLIQTSVDWMHLLPGLTAIALVGAAVLVWPRRLPAAARSRQPTRPAARRALLAAGVSALVATLIATGASLSRQGLADIYRARAQDELAREPAAALADAGRSLNIDSDSTRTYFIRAAALARFDRAGAAEAALRQALAREPNNFVTWGLLGDIALRERRLAVAKRDYGRAHALNPRDPALAQLARDPRSALG
jgi:tetratricopeptide (TPR) repeat protein